MLNNTEETKKNITRQGDNLASEVTVHYDPSIVAKYQKRKKPLTAEEKRLAKEYDEDLKRQSQGIGGSRLSMMGLESSMGKDQRKFQLQTLINNKEVVTLQSAASKMGLSKGTIVTYLKELNYQMWDTDTNKFVGAKDGKEVWV